MVLGNLNVENAIIYHLLSSTDAQVEILSSITIDDFENKEDRLIIETAKHLQDQNKVIDIISVMQASKNLHSDPVCVSVLMDKTAVPYPPSGLSNMIGFLKEKSSRRKLLHLSDTVRQLALEDTEAPNETAAKAIGELESIIQRTGHQQKLTFSQIATATIRNIIDHDGQELGLQTGFDNIDSLMSGLCAPDLTVVAAGPGEGKSTFALNIADNVAAKYPDGEVLFFSLEMKASQIVYKLLSSEFDIAVSDVRNKVGATKLLSTKITERKNLQIIDDGSMDIDKLCAFVKLVGAKKKISLVVIDYLQLLGSGAGKTYSNRNNEITFISRKIKQLAMSENVPILSLSQLNREKGRKVYKKSDLRESGAIEQDADNIVFIYRPSEHNLNEYNFGEGLVDADESDAAIIVDKCRLGQRGIFRMKFNGTCSRFENYIENNIDYQFNDFSNRSQEAIF